MVFIDVLGNYVFINVLDGNYRIVEVFGIIGGVLILGDFVIVIVGLVLIVEMLFISFVINFFIGLINLDGIIFNILLIIVVGLDIIN